MVSPLVLKRPILVGGLGLTASLWLLNTLQHSVDGSLVTSALVVGAGSGGGGIDPPHQP
jgi:hypothetical protein